MVHVNDQNPFDVTPDDGRPADVTPGATPAAAAPDRETEHDTDAPPMSAAETEASTDEADAARAKRKHRRIAALSVAAAVIFTAGAGGGAAASLALARSTTAASANGGTSQSQMQGGPGGSWGGSQSGTGGTSGGFGGSQGGFGGSQGGSGSGSGTGSSTTGSTAATAEQSVGLVTIVSKLGYESGEAAGTGIILTSNGRILTNNHVIDGATAIQVTVQSTGRTYSAQVVGTNATKDVAVLQLEDASGLTPADLAARQAAVGDDVTAVGNANGTGSLSAAAGTVSALDQTITTSSEGGTAGETLHGLIEIDADVVSGDSGGAVENADGDVIGVTTAASSGTSNVTGYAIPIDSALSIAKQIVAGDDTDEITIGLPAFLGVSLSQDSSQAVIEQVLTGTAAAKTDLAAGDTITSVNGTAIDTASELSAAIAKHAPGDRISVGYTDTTGADHTVTVTLTEGPAD